MNKDAVRDAVHNNKQCPSHIRKEVEDIIQFLNESEQDRCACVPPRLNDKVKIYSNEKGFAVKVVKDISPGEEVFTDTAAATAHATYFSPNDCDTDFTHPGANCFYCETCCAAVFNAELVLCDICSKAAYCSKDCREKDSKRHQLECPFLVKSEANSWRWGGLYGDTLGCDIRLLLRTLAGYVDDANTSTTTNDYSKFNALEKPSALSDILSLPLRTMQASQAQAKSSSSTTAATGAATDKEREVFFHKIDRLNFIIKSFVQQDVKLKQDDLPSSITDLKYVPDDDSESEDDEEQEDQTIAKLVDNDNALLKLARKLSVAQLVKLLLQIERNGFVLRRGPFTKEVKCFFVGSAFVNHSCEPNCTISLEDNNLIFRAKRFIPKDEEVTISYSFFPPGIEIFSKRLRGPLLGFQCLCERCKSGFDTPLLTDNAIKQLNDSNEMIRTWVFFLRPEYRHDQIWVRDLFLVDRCSHLIADIDYMVDLEAIPGYPEMSTWTHLYRYIAAYMLSHPTTHRFAQAARPLYLRRFGPRVIPGLSMFGQCCTKVTKAIELLANTETDRLTKELFTEQTGGPGWDNNKFHSVLRNLVEQHKQVRARQATRATPTTPNVLGYFTQLPSAGLKPQGQVNAFGVPYNPKPPPPRHATNIKSSTAAPITDPLGPPSKKQKKEEPTKTAPTQKS
eukprot:TRINITY_DN51964_c0_g1_i1.p1 TRINITY_DN51964_c0_g1~~TRINITY_DN51964_c0_g1_i1.p1  ORF type:complete len:678 (-),score=35.13 TRINITY_DN51964_c0_g1_i1:90-2123(-)